MSSNLFHMNSIQPKIHVHLYLDLNQLTPHWLVALSIYPRRAIYSKDAFLLWILWNGKKKKKICICDCFFLLLHQTCSQQRFLEVFYYIFFWLQKFFLGFFHSTKTKLISNLVPHFLIQSAVALLLLPTIDCILRSNYLTNSLQASYSCHICM